MLTSCGGSVDTKVISKTAQKFMTDCGFKSKIRKRRSAESLYNLAVSYQAKCGEDSSNNYILAQANPLLLSIHSYSAVLAHVYFKKGTVRGKCLKLNLSVCTLRPIYGPHIHLIFHRKTTSSWQTRKKSKRCSSFQVRLRMKAN